MSNHTGIVATFALLLLSYGTILSSGNLHAMLLRAVLAYSMRLHDSTLRGTLLNCFSRDMDIIDYTLFLKVEGVILCVLEAVISVAVISFSTPWFIPTSIPLVILYCLVQVCLLYVHVCTHARLIHVLKIAHRIIP